MSQEIFNSQCFLDLDINRSQSQRISEPVQVTPEQQFSIDVIPTTDEVRQQIREVPKTNWMCSCHPGQRNFLEIKQKLIEFAETKCQYMCIGPIENCKYEKLPGGIGFRAKEPREECENHIHFCFRLLTKTRFTPLKKMLLFCTPDIEEEKFGMKQCEQYCTKSASALYRMGEVLSLQEKNRRVTIAAEQTGPTNRIKVSLEECFKTYKTVREFKLECPQMYAKFSTGIKDVYSERIRDIPCVKPKIYWYYGKTRCGKTFQALKDIGQTTPKPVPWCYYANGPIHWYSNYAGQEMILFNEYRKSSLQDFCNTLSVLEGYPADQEYKGGFVPIRAKIVIFTCPRPPQAITVNGEDYRGEFESQDRYGSEHLNQAWEDVAQIVERIRESGGKMICFQKEVAPTVGAIYKQTDTTYQGITRAE